MKCSELWPPQFPVLEHRYQVKMIVFSVPTETVYVLVMSSHLQGLTSLQRSKRKYCNPLRHQLKHLKIMHQNLNKLLIFILVSYNPVDRQTVKKLIKWCIMCVFHLRLNCFSHINKCKI